MKEESLNRAIEIKNRLKQLETEDERLIDFLPPTRKALAEQYPYKNIFGRIMLLFWNEKRKPAMKQNKYSSVEFELTNDDVCAMIDLRVKEMKELQAELEKL